MKLHNFVGDFPTFVKRFMQDQVLISPYFEHVHEAWTKHDNLLFIFYEEMKADIKSVINKVCEFLDSTLTEDQIQELVDHLDIKNFRNNSSVNQEHLKQLGRPSKYSKFKT